MRLYSQRNCASISIHATSCKLSVFFLSLRFLSFFCINARNRNYEPAVKLSVLFCSYLQRDMMHCEQCCLVRCSLYVISEKKLQKILLMTESAPHFKGRSLAVIHGSLAHLYSLPIFCLLGIAARLPHDQRHFFYF